jgi:hypothetical protein
MLDKARIASFSQVAVMEARKGVNASATAGACHCFSLHWLSTILRNPGGAASDRMAVLGRGNGGANLILQKVFGTRWLVDGAGGANADFLVTQNYRLTTNDSIPYGAYNPDALAHKLTVNSTLGTGFIYSYWFNGSVVGAKGGAHSIAFYATSMGSRPMIHVFDPNFGEYLLTGDEFAKAFFELMGKYGPVRSPILRFARPS